MSSDPQVLTEVTDLVSELAGDWDYEGSVGPSTRFLADLGMESLDLVVLGTTLQGRYGMLPFAQFLAAMGARPVEDRDVTIAELVEFVSEHRAGPRASLVPGGQQ